MAMSPEQVAARQAFDKMLEDDAAESGDEIGAQSPRESAVHFDPYMSILPPHNSGIAPLGPPEILA